MLEPALKGLIEHAPAQPRALAEAQGRGETAVLLGEGTRVLAAFSLADEPREQAPGAVRALREHVDHVVMLTGDSEPVARAVAGRTGIEEWRAGLLPEDKLALIRELGEAPGRVAMVGDGVNDAPALAGATVGVAMGAAGSDIALESADVALMGDALDRLPEALEHSRRALRIMRQNVAVSLVTKAVFVILAPLGYVTLVVAVVADMGISLLVTLNGLRLVGRGRGRTAAVSGPTDATPRRRKGCCAGEDEPRTVQGGRGSLRGGRLHHAGLPRRGLPHRRRSASAGGTGDAELNGSRRGAAPLRSRLRSPGSRARRQRLTAVRSERGLDSPVKRVVAE